MTKPLLRVGVDASPLAGRTGVGNYVSALLQVMCEQHPDVQFFLFANTAIDFPALPNVIFKAAPSKWRGPLWHTFALGPMLNASGVQVFWGTNGYLPPYRLKGVATVVTIHDLAERFAPETQARLVRWARTVLQPRAARVADRVIAVSAATGNDIQSFYGRKVDEVIHPLLSSHFRPVHRADAGPTLAKYDLPERFLLTVGTLEPRKNIASLIAAYVDRKNKGVDLPLLVHVGGDGWRDTQIQQMIAEAVEKGWLRRLGYIPREDLPALYSGCEIFLMPSTYEGFGMPLVEAQLCGAPVVHGAHGSMAEAAGGLGVPVGPTQADLMAMFDDLARGQCRLACRLPHDIVNDAGASAERLWKQLLAANEQH